MTAPTGRPRVIRNLFPAAWAADEGEDGQLDVLCCWGHPGPAWGPGLILPDHQLRFPLSPAFPSPHRPSTALRPGRFVNREEVETHAWTSGGGGKEVSMGLIGGWLVGDRRGDKDKASSEDEGDRNEIDRNE